MESPKSKKVTELEDFSTHVAWSKSQSCSVTYTSKKPKCLAAYHSMLKYTHTRIYRLNGIEEFSLGDEMLLYFPEEAIGVSLNSSSRAIWELCDGRHTPAEISQELSQRFGASGNDLLANELLSDVMAAVIQLRDLGVLDFEKAPPN